MQAIQDMEKLIELERSALKDPVEFIEKLKKKEDLGIPFRQNIPELPYINWSKYSVPVAQETLALINQGGAKYQRLPSPKKEKNYGSSTTHNQAWTSEEQKKLEELLIKYPPEAVEMRRFEKIANELGNRTVKQVTSRVQKYFLKLYKAGLPIPGRIPKTVDKKKAHKHQRHNHLLYKPSTFFPETDVPVYMPEDDDEATLRPNVPPPIEEPSTSASVNISKTEEVILKVDLLKRIKMEKIRSTNIPPALHIGYKCDICNEEPLKGCRWHCRTCRHNSVDFCTDCLITQLQSANPHALTHQLVALHNAESAPGGMKPCSSSSSSRIPKLEIKSEPDSSSDSNSDSDSNWNNTTGYNSEDSHLKDFDQDYVSENFAAEARKYNYLDPNFLPELYKN